MLLLHEYTFLLVNQMLLQDQSQLILCFNHLSQLISFEVLDLCGKFCVDVNESKTKEFSIKISKPALLVMVHFLEPAYIFSNQTLSIQKQDIATLGCRLLL